VRARRATRGRDRAGSSDNPADREGAELAAAACGFHATIVVVQITTFGDLLLDVIVQLDRPLVAGDDQTAITRIGAGGQAANVAAWACELGARARFVGKRGDDTAGRLVAAELLGRGVEIVGPAIGRTGVVVSLASDGDRTMASDRGAAPYLEPRELDDAWFDCDVLHLSGYSLLREPIAATAVAAAHAARAHQAQVSVDLSTWALADDAFRMRVREVAPDVVFANARERAALGALETRWVLKRGADGVRVDGRDFAALAADAIDTTGAGDAFAAGFLIGGVELGLEAAARCCAQLGTMP
jgi:ribokinase